MSVPYRKVPGNFQDSRCIGRRRRVSAREPQKQPFLVGTTQAIDLVTGGVKVNALPECAYAVINHRISVESSVAATLNHDASLVEPLAKVYNLSYTAFDDHMDGDMKTSGPGKVTLSTVFEARLEPAPITPTEEDAGPYQVLSGSIRAAYNSHRGISGDDHIIVSP